MQNHINHESHSALAADIHGYVKELSETIGRRPVGSPGNRAATDFFTATVQKFGFAVVQSEFTCMHWEGDEVTLTAGNDCFHAEASPYSPGCRVTGQLLQAGTVTELENADLFGKIVLLHSELTREQLMPKNFPFYNPDHHQKIIALLEQKKPLAIIAATTRNPETAGAMYPFPLFMDGDFDIPSVYMVAEEGERLKQYCDRQITLTHKSRRIQSTGCNVLARKGAQNKARLVFCAHIDTHNFTPGALDNAAGVAVLMALAGMLRDYTGKREIEIIAFNGEDYYATPGQLQYLAQNRNKLGDIKLALNIDGAGYIDGRSAFSFYECPEAMATQVGTIISRYPGLFEGECWPQGDHSIFAQNQRPAVAFTSEKFKQLCAEITHTKKDLPELVDCNKLAEIALALRDVALDLK
ncbi:MAG TPA: M28 family peptidase [bacterium]|nr:M28 family peptidase [bacterium]HPN45888.1 M28 family peptidase [bacterium]